MAEKNIKKYLGADGLAYYNSLIKSWVDGNFAPSSTSITANNALDLWKSFLEGVGDLGNIPPTLKDIGLHIQDSVSKFEEIEQDYLKKSDIYSISNKEIDSLFPELDLGISAEINNNIITFTDAQVNNNKLIIDGSNVLVSNNKLIIE